MNEKSNFFFLTVDITKITILKKFNCCYYYVLTSIAIQTPSS